MARSKNKTGDPIAKRQAEILAHIIWYKSQNDGTSPSLRELAGAFGKTIGTIQTALKGLIEKGFLRHTKGQSRAFIVLRKPE